MRASNQTLAKNQNSHRTPSEAGRYVLLVDAQAKRSFDNWDAAEAEAKRILELYPRLHVGIEDLQSSQTAVRRRSSAR